MRIILKLFLVYMVAVSIISARTAAGSTDGKNATVYSNATVNRHLNQSSDIKVISDHIFISSKNESIEISEIVVFRNEGSGVYYSRDNHTFFAISTPPGMKNLKAATMECCLVEEKGMVLMDPMQPVAPGDIFKMQISYTLLPDGRAYVFNKSAVYNTTSLSIFIDKKGNMDVEGEGGFGTLTLQGNEYDLITFEDIIVGDTVSIPIKMTEKSGFFYAGIGLFFLLSIGLVYVFKGKLFKSERRYTLEELELEKRKIFHTIYGLEKHAGAVKSEEYDRLMEEYRQKVIRIFIEIDKIKNKN